VLRAAILLAAGVAVTSCGPGLRVVTDVNPEADFASYHTYRWTDEPPTAVIDRAVFTDIVVARIRWAIDSVLASKGYVEVADAPDVLVTWHGGVDARTRYVGGYGRHGWPYGPPGYRAPVRVDTWDQGTVLIEIIDADHGEMVWRGLGQTTLYEERDAEKRQAITSKAVARIMEDLPRAGTP
jgi:hypothetical protein